MDRAWHLSVRTPTRLLPSVRQPFSYWITEGLRRPSANDANESYNSSFELPGPQRTSLSSDIGLATNSLTKEGGRHSDDCCLSARWERQPASAISALLSIESKARESAWARPFALEGKLLGCFCEVRFPLFSSWPSTWTVLSNAAVRSEICGRFGGGSAGNSALLRKGRQLVRYMQIAQSRINTGDFVSR